MKYARLLIYSVLSSIIYSCSPTLNISEVEHKINEVNTALFEGDVEYLLNNTSKKYLKDYGENDFRKFLTEVYTKTEYPVGFSNIGDLVIQGRNKCNSFHYYNVTYSVTRSQMTPYLDSTALVLNQKKYGGENVIFNSNSKILHITEEKSQILIFDKDRRWKLHDYNEQFLDKYFDKGFSECIQPD